MHVRIGPSQIGNSTKRSRLYIEHIIAGLKKCGFVKSKKGNAGGYIRTKETITLCDIIESQEKKSGYENNYELLIKRKLREIII